MLLSYLAGVIDGEGTIRIIKSKRNPDWKPQYSAAISIGMTNKIPLEMLSKQFGVKVRKEEASVQNMQTLFRWSVGGNNKVPKILKRLNPYLRVKKEQALLAINFCEGRNWRNNKMIKCRECEGNKKIQGYGLCGACYQRNRDHGTLEKYKKDYIPNSVMPNFELQRRETFYQKMKKLNAVGAAATTKQEDTRKGEVIV